MALGKRENCIFLFFSFSLSLLLPPIYLAEKRRRIRSSFPRNSSAAVRDGNSEEKCKPLKSNLPVCKSLCNSDVRTETVGSYLAT